MYTCGDLPKFLNLMRNKDAFHLHSFRFVLLFILIDFPGVGPQ